MAASGSQFFIVTTGETALPGGPSDRRFSGWYASELDAWADGRYKLLRGWDKEADDSN